MGSITKEEGIQHREEDEEEEEEKEERTRKEKEHQEEPEPDEEEDEEEDASLSLPPNFSCRNDKTVPLRSLRQTSLIWRIR